VIAAALPAAAAQAVKIGQNNAWGTYSYIQNKAKVCYVLSVPLSKEPANLNHGDVFFFVSQKPGQNVSYEPQFIAGYELKKDSKVTLTVGNQTFAMFTKDNSAWLENAAQEPQLLAALRGGADMKVNATSGRGNATSYVFSLRGITAALNSIANCR
jgi:hypothetical protein